MIVSKILQGKVVSVVGDLPRRVETETANAGKAIKKRKQKESKIVKEKRKIGREEWQRRKKGREERKRIKDERRLKKKEKKISFFFNFTISPFNERFDLCWR